MINHLAVLGWPASLDTGVTVCPNSTLVVVGLAVIVITCADWPVCTAVEGFAIEC